MSKIVSRLETDEVAHATDARVLADLGRGLSTVWLAPIQDEAPFIDEAQIVGAAQRFTRFAPVLAELFDDHGWDGRISSPLERAPRLAPSGATLFVKADHKLPMTGTVKARGGVHELLCWIEQIGLEAGILRPDGPVRPLLEASARASLARRRIVVASTGNLGFSIGLVGRAFGVAVEVHMSRDAKPWKKSRLAELGVDVVEHACDYSRTVARARVRAAQSGAYFVDDEDSLRLFMGYAPAARELADQLAEHGVSIDASRPLVVYLPCGVGGAPGGVTAGLKLLFGDAVQAVFVEPVASACVLVGLARGGRADDVYSAGLDNVTVADGLAVPKASQLVLDLVGRSITAVVALRDEEMMAWVRRAWADGGLRLEPSAAASLAAIEPYIAARARAGRPLPADAVHVAWTTGGSMLPQSEFAAYLDAPAGPGGHEASGDVDARS